MKSHDSKRRPPRKTRIDLFFCHCCKAASIYECNCNWRVVAQYGSTRGLRCRREEHDKSARVRQLQEIARSVRRVTVEDEKILEPRIEKLKQAVASVSGVSGAERPALTSVPVPWYRRLWRWITGRSRT